VRKLVDAIKNLVIGLFTTGKHLGRHAVTLQYPDQKWEMPERSRGIVVLLSDKETGKLNCTTCLLCQRACPASAIKIDFEKGEKGKRFLKDFVIDFTLCCFCGLCEDSCNFAAIKMTGKYEFSTLNKADLIWHTDKLQEMGLDVPYEKPVKKKKVVKKAAPKTDGKPAVKEEKPVADRPKLEPSEEKKPESPAEPTAEEKKPVAPVEPAKEEIKPESPADDIKADEPKEENKPADQNKPPEEQK